MKITISMVRKELDALRDAGLSVDDIAQRLDLHQVHANSRTIKHWYSGKTNCRTVEYRALRDLNNEPKTTSD